MVSDRHYCAPLGATRIQKGLFIPSLGVFSSLLSLTLLIVASTISQWRPPQHQQQAPSGSATLSSTRQYSQSNYLELSPDFFNVDTLSSSTYPAPFFTDISSTAYPLVDPIIYDPQPPLFPGQALPTFSDTEYPDLIDNPAGIDWAALGSLPALSEPSESPNALEIPSNVGSPDPSPNPPSSTATTVSMSAVTSSDESPRGNPSRVTKRQLNTLAARRYRQRRVDRMNELEAELDAIKRERDELKMRVSKLEGETEALRSMLKEKSN